MQGEGFTLGLFGRVSAHRKLHEGRVGDDLDAHAADFARGDAELIGRALAHAGAASHKLIVFPRVLVAVFVGRDAARRSRPNVWQVDVGVGLWAGQGDGPLAGVDGLDVVEVAQGYAPQDAIDGDRAS